MNTGFKAVSASFGVVISVLDLHTVLQQSSGLIKSVRYYNDNGVLPTFGGLFCSYTFGKYHSIKCQCGRYKSKIVKYYPPCDTCIVSVRSKIPVKYGNRSGHIILPEPIIHPWLVDWVCMLLNIDFKELRQFASYKYPIYSKKNKVLRLFFNSSRGELYKVQTYSSDDPIFFKSSYVRELMGTGLLYLKYLSQVANFCLVCSLDSGNSLKLEEIPALRVKTRLLGRLLVRSIPVISPRYRPLIRIMDSSGGVLNFSSDINSHYTNLLSSVNNSFYLLKLSHRIVHGSFEVSGMWGSVRQLKRQIDYFNSYIESLNIIQHNLYSYVGGKLVGTKSPYSKKVGFKSITALLSRKEGLLRKDLLGRRVNYSGRSVITSGRHLKLTQCGVPWEIALELYRPLLSNIIWRVWSDLYGKNLSSLPYLRVHEFRRVLFSGFKYWYNILYKIVRSHPLLLNRAPTLHRYNIQGFEGVLTLQRTIQLHPLVCTSFNADFDGDQMAVYVPHSISAQVESRVLLFSINQVLSLADYTVMITASQDIVFGLYYATLPGIATNKEEVGDIHKVVHYHCKVTNCVIKTTAGRIHLYSIVKEFLPFESVNSVFNKKLVSQLIEKAWYCLEYAKFEKFCHQLMSFGFHYCYLSGISFHKNELSSPTVRNQLIKEVENSVGSLLRRGLYYGKSKSQIKEAILSRWTGCLDEVVSVLLLDIKHSSMLDSSTLYLLVDSKARGSVVQLRQLCAFRGLMMKPSGEILEIPILSSLGDGLSPFEYFLAAHGSRKGVIDTSIKTAVAGYLTRRMVNSINDIYIGEYDCGYTGSGILVKQYDFENKEEFYNNLLGCTLSRRVYSWEKSSIKVVADNGQLVCENLVHKLRDYCIEYVFIRKPIICQSSNGVCSKCYGFDLSKRELPEVGTNVGVIAGQSIGEPGTQLTMRTFHSGGVATSNILKDGSEAELSFRMIILGPVIHVYSETSNRKYSRVVGRDAKLLCIDSDFRLLAKYKLPYGSVVCYSDGDLVNKGSLIFQNGSGSNQIYSTSSGYIHYLPHISQANHAYRVLVICSKQSDFSDHLISQLKYNNLRLLERQDIIVGSLGYELYLVPLSYHIIHHKKSYVTAGSLIAYTMDMDVSGADITGGLPRISKLLESNHGSDFTVRSKVSGISEITINKKEVIFSLYKFCGSFAGTKLLDRVVVPYNLIKEISVQPNQKVFIGTPLCIVSKKVNKQEYLINMGDCSVFERLYRNLYEEISGIYRANGVSINQKHLDLILFRNFSYVKSKLTKTFMNKELFTTKALGNLLSGNITIGKSVLFTPSGITFSALNKFSGISSASFQKVSSGLVNNAFSKVSDPLLGPQEQVLLDRKLSSGTGSTVE